MADLVWTDVSCALGGAPVVRGVSLTLSPGALIALIGPNGAGKTTVLRAGAGLLAPKTGTVRLDGEDPRRMAPAQRARTLAYLPQMRTLAWSLSVRDVVGLGRHAYGAALSRLTGADAAAVDAALAACRLEALADRPMETLSGGEQARAHVARALASQAPLLIADEPVAMLDPRHAFETLSILCRFCADGGGALVSLHDLNLAARFADRIVLMHHGRIIADGAPAEALTPALLRDAFGIAATVSADGVVVHGPA